MKNITIITCLWAISLGAFGQEKKDSLPPLSLKEIIVPVNPPVGDLKQLPDEAKGFIYAGRKTEWISTDSISANKALDNTRTILGRVPGLVISEAQTGGFTANGIAIRGLNPVQSMEMNIRQNGYNISGDVFGYNEAYYLPAMEAVSHIEWVSGAAALQFGPQFGGLINYLLKDATTIQSTSFHNALTLGSYGLFNLFNSVEGKTGNWTYYGYGQYRSLVGWRPNSQQWQFSGYGHISYSPSKDLQISLQYTIQRNRVRMPGGLTDSMFQANPRASFRSRNYLSSPWNIYCLQIKDSISSRSCLRVQSSWLHGGRNLVWRNEDGGPGSLDTINPATGTYVAREVEKEAMDNLTTEIRIFHSYGKEGRKSSWSGGLRITRAWFSQREGGEGTTGNNYDLRITGEYPTRLRFTTTNLAPFAENLIHLGPRWTVCPGFRVEFLKSDAQGYLTSDSVSQYLQKSKQRLVPLLGLSIQFPNNENGTFYGNISQSYRPVTYSELTPVGTTSVVDPKLKDATGYTTELGFREIRNNLFYFDCDLFYLSYRNRPGLILIDPGTPSAYTFRTNVAASAHMGLESYVDFQLWNQVSANSARRLDVFNSLALIHARYVTGPYRGNQVEGAVPYVIRSGITYNSKRFTLTYEISFTGPSFADATNAKSSQNPAAGEIPSYDVSDIAICFRWNQFKVTGGIDNLLDRKFFTMRTDEYPGPGIIPSSPRSLYLTLSLNI